MFYRRATENIYNLLNSNGFCIISFVVNHPFMNVFESILEIPQWNPYKEMFDKLRRPSVSELEEILSKSKFPKYEYEVLNLEFAYKDIDVFRGKYSNLEYIFL